MKREELEQAVKKEYKETATATLSVLTRCPEIVLTYEHPTPRYTNPPEVEEYFQTQPDDFAYKASDGYMYFNDSSAVRMRDIGDAMNRIFASKYIQAYLGRLSRQAQPRLLPDDLTLFTFEGGIPSGRETIFFTACYALPEEDHYKLCVSASQKKGTSNAGFDIFITYPEDMHFDGEDHNTYPYHLLLAKGTTTRTEILKNPQFKRLPTHPLRLKDTSS